MPRPETMPKRITKKRAKTGAVAPQARRHVGRVNQKMIDQMIALRRQGFTHADIGQRLDVSPRTVRRHTEGVSPQLVHAGDETRIDDLLKWGAQQLRAIQRLARLTVQELDLALKAWRTAVSNLDGMTVEQLELDQELRARFLINEVWPPIHENIDTRRMELDIPGTPIFKRSDVFAIRPA